MADPPAVSASLTPVPGMIVPGPFFCDGHDSTGLIRAPSERAWTHAPESCVAVPVIVGDLPSGSYEPAALTAVADYAR